MQKINNLVRLLRVKQWIKNAFIVFPLLFSGYLLDIGRLTDTLIALISFCFIASSVYILNDFLDRKKDRIHPRKAQRPLAEKSVSVSAVIILIVLLLGAGLWMAWQANIAIFYTAVLYIIVHLMYNYLTKRIVILDVIFIAVGFQIRIWAGSFAAGVVPSVWLQLCVFLLALFLGFTKRRYEIAALKDQAHLHRDVLAHYTTYLLDQIIIICSTLTIVFYGLYVISAEVVNRLGNHNMIYSIGFVIYGIFRYLYLIHVKKLGDDPGEVMFNDKPLMIDIILWIVFISVILYPALAQFKAP